MSVPDQVLLEFMQRISEDLGSLKSSQANLEAYIQSVSANEKATRKDLQEHADSEAAHGVSAERGVWARVALAVGSVGGLAGLWVAIKDHWRPH